MSDVVLNISYLISFNHRDDLMVWTLSLIPYGGNIVSQLRTCGLGSETSSFKFGLCHFLALSSWESQSVFLSLKFLLVIWKSIIVRSISIGLSRVLSKIMCIKFLLQYLAKSKYSVLDIIIIISTALNILPKVICRGCLFYTRIVS